MAEAPIRDFRSSTLGASREYETDDPNEVALGRHIPAVEYRTTAAFAA
jgi:hypothetical protein